MRSARWKKSATSESRLDIAEAMSDGKIGGEELHDPRQDQVPAVDMATALRQSVQER